METLTAKIDDKIAQKKALNEQESLQESANIIQAQRDQELALGIRKPSTYKERANEFMSKNADYKGNDYLLVLSEKHLSKNIESLELLRETAKYKELNKKEQKKLEAKVTKRLKLAKKVKPIKSTPPKENFIDKNIRAIQMLLKLNQLDATKKVRFVKRLEALTLLKKLNT